MHQIENSKQANFSGFQQPAMTLKIDPQKFNLTQITCKLFNSKFLSSKQDFFMTRIKQSEVYEKYDSRLFGVFVETRSAVTVF